MAVGAEFRRDSTYSALLEGLEMRDPRVARSVSVLSLFEQQQQRLPRVDWQRCFYFMTIYPGLPPSAFRPS